MFEQVIKNIDDILWKEAGCTTELDYTEQTSWMLFLKYLDDLELDKVMQAELKNKSYEFIIDEVHRWSGWAAPKTASGEFDHNNAKTGDDLIDYVNRDLFPYLQGFKQRATGRTPSKSVSYGTGGETGTASGQMLVSAFGEAVVPIPAAVWLFGSGLISLIGLARRKSFVGK